MKVNMDYAIREQLMWVGGWILSALQVMVIYYWMSSHSVSSTCILYTKGLLGLKEDHEKDGVTAGEWRRLIVISRLCRRYKDRM